MGFNKSRRPLLTPEDSTSIISGVGSSQTYSEAIYGKVIDDTGSGTYSTGANTIAHGLTLSAGSGNVETIVDLEGFVKRDSANENLTINYGSTSGQGWSISTIIGDTNIKLSVGINWSGGSTLALSDAIISLEYTKQT